MLIVDSLTSLTFMTLFKSGRAVLIMSIASSTSMPVTRRQMILVRYSSSVRRRAVGSDTAPSEELVRARAAKCRKCLPADLVTSFDTLRRVGQPKRVGVKKLEIL